VDWSCVEVNPGCERKRPEKGGAVPSPSDYIIYPHFS
jgi:hypothetical protein